MGSQVEKEVEVRVVAATNADLQQQIQAGAFRQDLYFRLARFVIEAPPLRQRREDIPLLAGHFLALFAREMNLEPPLLSPETLAALEAYDFPGNVRELKNAVERALIESQGHPIRPEHLHLGAAASAAALPAVIPALLPLALDQTLEQTEEALVRRALEQTRDNVAAAARLLGTNRNRIYRWIKKG
jgi:DNA-binding NtrC family response regulator